MLKNTMLLQKGALALTGIAAVGLGTGLAFYVHACRVVFGRRPPRSLRALANVLSVTRPFSIAWRLLTARLRRRPTVYVLGEVRCGTTSLSSMLRTELGMVGPFTPWVHPLADNKESFFFVGHYWGLVAPSLYGMAYPLKLVSWARRTLARMPPQLCFDGCASYLSAPWVPRLLKRVTSRPVLVVCLREPVAQNVSYGISMLCASFHPATRAVNMAVNIVKSKQKKQGRFIFLTRTTCW